MNRIYWDSMLFVYLIEGNPVYAPKVLRLQAAIQQRGDQVCTSIFTLGEVLTGPRKAGDEAGMRRIREFFAGKTIEVLPFGVREAEQYSIVRAGARVSPADGIHLAAASANGVDLFVTNDERLHKLSIPGIRFFSDLDGKVI